MSEKIQLLNPDPSKKGAVVDKYKYELVKKTILNILHEKGTISFKELMGEVVDRLENSFDDSPSWYCTAMKLDLEAKKEIKRVNQSSPQLLTLTKEKDV